MKIQVLKSDKVISTPFVSKNLEQLHEDYSITFLVDSIEQKISIKSGYKWDGASIPRYCWSIIGGKYMPRFREASLVHDYMYENGLINKEVADRLFLELLDESSVKGIRRKLMYGAVRLFGRGSY